MSDTPQKEKRPTLEPKYLKDNSLDESNNLIRFQVSGTSVDVKATQSGFELNGMGIMAFPMQSLAVFMRGTRDINREAYEILLEQAARDGARHLIEVIYRQTKSRLSVENLILINNSVGRISGWGKAELLKYDSQSFQMHIRLRECWEGMVGFPGSDKSSAFFRGHWAALAEALWNKPAQAKELPCLDDETNCVEFIITPSEISFEQTAPQSIADSTQHIRDHLEKLVEERTKELAESEGKYKTVVENSPNYIFIIQDGQMVFFNKKSQEIIGPRFLNLSLEEIITSVAPPEYRELIWENMSKRMSGEEIPDYEIDMLDRKGKLRRGIVKNKMITYRGRPALEGIIIDITDAHMAKQKLKLMYQAIDQTKDAAAVVSIEGSVLFANAAWAKMHQMNIEECVGQNFSIFHDSGRLNEMIAPFIERISLNGYHQGEIEHRRKDGTVFVVWMTVTLLKDEQGKSLGAVAIARDMTEHKQQKEQEIQSEKMITSGLLASGLAHEINNPLTGIYSAAQLLEREFDDMPEKAQSHLKKILACSERIQGLVSRFLSIARPQHEPVFQEIDLNLLIEQELALVTHLITKGIKVETDLAKNLPEIRGDQDLLVTLISNLVINALQALQAKGDILTIQTRSDKTNGINLRVHDNGPGIPGSDLKRIFEPFYTTKDQQNGTGLGLYSVSNIVNLHHASIEVNSKKGKFTEFVVHLPAG